MTHVVAACGERMDAGAHPLDHDIGGVNQGKQGEQEHEEEVLTTEKQRH